MHLLKASILGWYFLKSILTIHHLIVIFRLVAFKVIVDMLELYLPFCFLLVFVPSVSLAFLWDIWTIIRILLWCLYVFVYIVLHSFLSGCFSYCNICVCTAYWYHFTTLKWITKNILSFSIFYPPQLKNRMS